MIWKCPPLNLPIWNNLYKWKEQMKLYKYTIVYQKSFITAEPRVFEARELEVMKRQLEICSHISNTTATNATLEIRSSEIDTMEWKINE